MPLAPCPIALVTEPVRRQQQLERRVLAVLHHELLYGGVDFRVQGVHGAAGLSIGMNAGSGGPS